MRRRNALKTGYAPCAAANVPLRDGVSGEDVGDQRVFEFLDLIFQAELALLHPGKFELVAIARTAHHVDLGIEATMLSFQDSEELGWIIVVHYSGVIAGAGAGVTSGDRPRTGGGPMQSCGTSRRDCGLLGFPND